MHHPCPRALYHANFLSNPGKIKIVNDCTSPMRVDGIFNIGKPLHKWQQETKSWALQVSNRGIRNYKRTWNSSISHSEFTWVLSTEHFVHYCNKPDFQTQAAVLSIIHGTIWSLEISNSHEWQWDKQMNFLSFKKKLNLRKNMQWCVLKTKAENYSKVIQFEEGKPTRRERLRPMVKPHPSTLESWSAASQIVPETFPRAHVTCCTIKPSTGHHLPFQ